MKKWSFMLVLIIIGLLCSCSSTSNIQSNSNAELSPESNYTSLQADNYEEKYLSFETAVINLMYDCEFDTVKKIHQYNPDGVNSILEKEFGTNDMESIIDYLNQQAKVIITTCKYCNEPVYANDAVHLSTDCKTEQFHTSWEDCPNRSYVHSKCLLENDPPKIQKDH